MRVKRNIFILLIGVMILAIGCGKENYLEKGDKLVEKGEFEEAEEYYFKALENDENEDVYIRLADLYRDIFEYTKEKNILLDGNESFRESRILKARLAEVNRFEGDSKTAINTLKGLLDDEYEDAIMDQLANTYRDSYERKGIEGIYKKHRSKIKSLETKINIYEILRSLDTDLKEDLEEEILKGDNIRGFELVIEDKTYDDLEKAKSIIEKARQYNKIGSNIVGYDYKFKNEDKEVMSIEKGNFIEDNKEDVVLVYRDKEDQSNLYVSILDGLTGEELISYVEEDAYVEYSWVEPVKFKDDRDKLALISRIAMSASTPPSFKILDIRGEELVDMGAELENDIKVDPIEGFKIQVSSPSLKVKYIVDVPENEYSNYIGDEQFDDRGRGIGYVNLFTDGYGVKLRGSIEDSIKVNTGFGGTYQYSAERLGNINEIYNFIDGKLKLTYLNVDNIENTIRKSESKDGIGIIYIKEDIKNSEKTRGNNEDREEIL